jgi:hypothetical protein
MASWPADAFHAEVLADAQRLLFGERATKGACGPSRSPPEAVVCEAIVGLRRPYRNKELWQSETSAECVPL